MLNIKVGGVEQAVGGNKVIKINSGDKVTVSVDEGASYQVLISDNQTDVILQVTNSDGSIYDVVLEGLASLYGAGDIITQLLLDIDGESMVVASMADLLGALDATAADGDTDTQNRSFVDDNANIDPNRSAALDSDQLRPDGELAGLGIDAQANEQPIVADVLVFQNEIQGVEQAGDLNIITGQLVAFDPNIADTHTFAMVAGTLSVTDTNGVITLIDDTVEATINPDGSYTISGDFNDLSDGEIATVTFDYTATDLGGLTSVPATVTFTVTGTNDIPVVEDIGYSTDVEGRIVDLYTDGSFITAWRSWDESTIEPEPDGLKLKPVFEENIWVQRYDVNGSTDGDPILAHTNTSGDSYDITNMSIIALSDGGFAVNWMNFDDGEIRSLKFSSDNIETNSSTIEDVITGHKFYQVIELNDGTLATIWRAFNEDTEVKEILVQRDGLDTEPIVVATNIDDWYDNDGYSAYNGIELNKFFELEPYGDSGFVAVWRQTHSEYNDDYSGSIKELQAVRYDDSGNAIDTTPIAVAEGEYGFGHPEFTALAENPAGQTGLITWRLNSSYDTDNDSSTDNSREEGFYAQFINADGNVTDPILLLESGMEQNNTTYNIDGIPDVVALANGTFAVSWVSNNYTDDYSGDKGDDNESTILYTRLYDATGDALTDAYAVFYDADNVETGKSLKHASFFDVQATEDGGYVIAWFSDSMGYDGDDFNESNNFHYYKFDSAGELLFSRDPIFEVKDGTNVISGLLTVADDDVMNEHEFRVLQDTIEVTHSERLYIGDGEDLNAELLETPEVNAQMILNEETGTWEYHIVGDFNYLSLGESATITFQYVADDLRGFDGTDGIHESSISEPATITLTIIGTNDQPMVSHVVNTAEGVDYTRETYDNDAYQNGSDDTQHDILTTLTGTLSATDDDVHNAHRFYTDNLRVSSEDINPGEITNLSLNLTDNSTSDSTPNSTGFEITGDFNALGRGETATVTFEYYADDREGFGSDGDDLNEPSRSEPELVTITIMGTNDQPVVKDISANGITESKFWNFDDGIPQDLVVDGGNTNHRTYGNTSWSSGSDYVLNFFESGGRSVVIADQDTTAGGTLSFGFIYGTGYNGGERVDGGEEVSLQYSTNNGSSWTHYSTLALSTYQDGNWHQVSFDLNGDLNSSDIDFRLIQNNYSGSCCDHWAINNLQIGSSTSVPVYESNDITDVIVDVDTQEDINTTFIATLNTVSDDDVTDTHTYELDSSVNTPLITYVNDLGVTVTVDASSMVSVYTTDGGTTWEYKIDGDFNFLDIDQTATVTFDYVAIDNSLSGNGDEFNETSRSEPQTITLEITGTNDQPIVSGVEETVSEESLLGIDGTIMEDSRYENSVAYTVSDDDNNNGEANTHTFAIDEGTLTLSITTANQAFLSFFSLTDLAQAESIVESWTNGVIDFDILNIDGDVNVADSVTVATAQTITVPQFIIDLLANYHILNIEMDLDGAYSVQSPLFNMLGASDSVTLGFDYRATDNAGVDGTSSQEVLDLNELSQSEAATVTLIIQGTNDKPVAYPDEYRSLESSLDDTTVGGVNSVFSGELPGAATGSILGDIFTRMNVNDLKEGMDEDLFDNATLKFYMEGDRIATTVIEETPVDQADDVVVVDKSLTSVIVNEDGTFSVTNPTFDNLAVGERATVMFQYYVDDLSGAVSTDETPEVEDVDNLHESTRSEPVTVTVTIIGSNDRPTIENVNLNDTQFTIYETHDNDAYQNGIDDTQDDIPQTILGRLSASDDDVNDEHIFSIKNISAHDGIHTLPQGQGTHQVKFEEVDYDKNDDGQIDDQVKILVESATTHVGHIHLDTITLLSNDGTDSQAGFRLTGNFNALGVGESATVTFKYMADDQRGFGMNGSPTDEASKSEPKLVTMTITGTNDQPIVTADKVYESLESTNAVTTEIVHTFEVTDDDINDTHEFSLVSIANVNELSSGYVLTDPVTYIDNEGFIHSILMQIKLPEGISLDEISIDSIQVIDNQFTLVGDFEILSGGIGENSADQLDVKFKYFAEDNQGLSGEDGINESSTSETRWITVEITGTNDVPTISVNDAPSDMDEDIHVDQGMLSTYGSLVIADVDNGEDLFDTTVSYKPTAYPALLGLFVIDANGNWNYHVDNENVLIQGLNNNEYIEQTYTVQSIDGTASSDVTVKIWGTNDDPVIQTSSITPNETLSGVVGTIVASDVDSSILTYSLIGSSMFEIDPVTGEISTIPGFVLDAELENSYTLVVRVIDGDGGIDIKSVDVDVQDITGVVSYDETQYLITNASLPGSYNENQIITTTYNLGSEYANTEVTVEFDINLNQSYGHWNSNDSIEITANGEVVIQNGTHQDGVYHIEMQVISDVNGNINMSFDSDTYNDSIENPELWSMNNLEITSQDQVLTFDSNSEGEIDMVALLSQSNDFEDGADNLVNNPDSLDEIDLSSGEHTLSNLSVTDFIAMTDDDNTLEIAGDSADNIKLDVGEWMIASNDDSNVDGIIDNSGLGDGDGFITYTNIDAASGAAQQSLQLLIDDSIDVDLV